MPAAGGVVSYLSQDVDPPCPPGSISLEDSVSKIEWTEKTWNPVTGCTKVSAGCRNCYAAGFHRRLRGTGHPNYQEKFSEVRFHPKELQRPHKWKKPRRVFVCSMSDIFHPQLPDAGILALFMVMNTSPRHTYQILTKRPERLITGAVRRHIKWTPNIWLGVTVEDNAAVTRIPMLQGVKGPAVKFVSFEPLLEHMIALNLEGIDWGIIGGEKSPYPNKARPMSVPMVCSIIDACRGYNVKIFFKQWGRYFNENYRRGVSRKWIESVEALKQYPDAFMSQ